MSPFRYTDWNPSFLGKLIWETVVGISLWGEREWDTAWINSIGIGTYSLNDKSFSIKESLRQKNNFASD